MESTSSTPPPADQNLVIVAYVAVWSANHFSAVLPSSLRQTPGYSHGNDPEPLAVEVERRYRAGANHGGYVSWEV